MSKSKVKFNDDELVFAKVGNFPLWPGMIVCVVAKSKVPKFNVQFFGSNDLKPVEASSIIKYSEKVLKDLKRNTDDHTKPYIEGLKQIEEKCNEEQAAKNDTLTSSPLPALKSRLTRSSRSSSSISSASSSASSSTNVQPKSESRATPKKKFTTNQSKRSRDDDDTSDDEPEKAAQKKTKRRKKTLRNMKKVPSEASSNASSDTRDLITYSLDLKEIHRELGEQSVNITFEYVRNE